MSPPRPSILLPTPLGPQPGITPQPITTSASPTEPPSPLSDDTTTITTTKPKARLAEPEIVYLPAEPAPYASDDESEAGEEDDGEHEGEVLGEDGQPKARGMLRNLDDDTDVRARILC